VICYIIPVYLPLVSLDLLERFENKRFKFSQVVTCFRGVFVGSKYDGLPRYKVFVRDMLYADVHSSSISSRKKEKKSSQRQRRFGRANKNSGINKRLICHLLVRDILSPRRHERERERERESSSRIRKPKKTLEFFFRGVGSCRRLSSMVSSRVRESLSRRISHVNRHKTQRLRGFPFPPPDLLRGGSRMAII